MAGEGSILLSAKFHTVVVAVIYFPLYRRNEQVEWDDFDCGTRLICLFHMWFTQMHVEAVNVRMLVDKIIIFLRHLKICCYLNCLSRSEYCLRCVFSWQTVICCQLFKAVSILYSILCVIGCMHAAEHSTTCCFRCHLYTPIVLSISYHRFRRLHCFHSLFVIFNFQSTFIIVGSCCRCCCCGFAFLSAVFRSLSLPLPLEFCSDHFRIALSSLVCQRNEIYEFSSAIEYNQPKRIFLCCCCCCCCLFRQLIAVCFDNIIYCWYWCGCSCYWLMY